ncbi:stage V sporulation protein AB [uncultured Eubacterium sp.]|uniref:stage V sporulation protein AB n=1 Tax=uncultured Eubacterium sp. TaxID=165185 RepID=UPI002616C727|nr:stage V sporulation protein AB [uncultured Eubacterium sp.]
MIIKYIVMALTAFGGGTVISAAVFALIASTGVITRMAGKTHTAKHVRTYETAVVIGGVLWNVIWVFSVRISLKAEIYQSLQLVMSLAQGIFVGCLAVSLAEALNATAIFARRVKLKVGLSFVILAVAVGKVLASVIQFTNNWVKK